MQINCTDPTLLTYRPIQVQARAQQMHAIVDMTSALCQKSAKVGLDRTTATDRGCDLHTEARSVMLAAARMELAAAFCQSIAWVERRQIPNQQMLCRCQSWQGQLAHFDVVLQKMLCEISSGV